MKEPFIQIQQRLYDCNSLDIYHINIISWIASYQRQDQPFFMSKIELARKFVCDKKTVYRRFADLEKHGIVYKDGKYKRSHQYKVSAYHLDRYLSGTHLDSKVPQSLSSSKKSTSEVHYKTNNKTSSNKTSFREEEALFERSSSKTPKGPNLKQMEAFVYELNKEQ